MPLCQNIQEEHFSNTWKRIFQKYDIFAPPHSPLPPPPHFPHFLAEIFLIQSSQKTDTG